MKPGGFSLLTICSIILVGGSLFACGGGGGGSSPSPPVVTVSLSPASGSVPVDNDLQFTATVQNATNQAVNWSVSGPGCTGNACGTITASGLYSAPSIVPSPPTVTVKATSVADPGKSSPASVTITSSAAVSVWPALAKVEINGTRQFGARVSGSSNTAVDWSVSGAGCTGNGCGTVSPTGLYTGPTSLPVPGTVAVTATSKVDPGKSASATVDLVDSANARLKGRYAFLFQGYGLNEPGGVSGFFIADGAGNITDGRFDRTWLYPPGGNLTDASILGGAYLVSSDGRGFMTWNFIQGTVTFAFVLNATGEKAFLQSFYDTSTKNTGTFLRQANAPFSNSAIQDNYVLLFNGTDNNSQRIASVGRLQADGNGNVTGNLDINDGASLHNYPGMTATYSVGANSRGTMTITVPALGTFSYALYVVSQDRFFLQSIDPVTGSAPFLAGEVIKQSGGPFSNASLNGTSVFDLVGRPGPNQAKVSIGLLTGNGSGNITGVADINNNNVISANTSYTATYTIDSAGRGTLASSTLPGMIFYMVRPGAALLMEAPGSSVQTGSFEPQSPLPYSDALLIGQFANGTSMPPPYANNAAVTGAVTWSVPGIDTYTDDINSTVGGLVTSPGSGKTSVASNGRVIVSGTGGGTAYQYMISPVKYVLILGAGLPTDPDDQKLLFRAEQ